MTTWRWLAILGMALGAGSTVACGGGDDDTGSAADSESAEADADAPEDGSGDDDEGSTGDDAASDGDFCEQTRALREQEDASPDEGFELFLDIAEEVTPPEEIAADWESAIDGSRRLLAALEQIEEEGLDLDSDTTGRAIAIVDEAFTAEDVATGQRVRDFIVEECGEGEGD